MLRRFFQSFWSDKPEHIILQTNQNSFMVESLIPHEACMLNRNSDLSVQFWRPQLALIKVRMPDLDII